MSTARGFSLHEMHAQFLVGLFIAVNFISGDGFIAMKVLPENLESFSFRVSLIKRDDETDTP
jgi:hypothetical protein